RRTRRGPRTELPEDGLDGELAYQLVHDEAMLDGNARLNLVTFVGTWMDPAGRLYAKATQKDMVDKDEYPAIAEIDERCGRILARRAGAAAVAGWFLSAVWRGGLCPAFP